MSDGLGETGKRLYEAVSDGRKLSVPHEVLLLNACRIADRLDEIDAELPRKGLTVTNDQGTESVNPLIPEQRQQLAQLGSLLARMGIKELPEIGHQTSIAEELAKQRERRQERTLNAG